MAGWGRTGTIPADGSSTPQTASVTSQARHQPPMPDQRAARPGL